tara:strand:- start:5434 stop:6141 length:708 start_codon:yes stop_codon:yes gene_type:complete
MMLDFSDCTVSNGNVENITYKIKEKSSKKINTVWLGTQKYEPIFNLQKKIHEFRINDEIRDVVLMLEHDHVYTLGKNANSNHILSKENNVFQTDRGGDVTYHGPGQLVCYPILNLVDYNKSITWYVNILQESILSTLSTYKIIAKKKSSPHTGVWVEDNKIAAIGIRLSRWTSMHGFSLNVNTDLSYYDNIIPCGIFDYGITSISEITNEEVNVFDFAQQASDILLNNLTTKAIC